jgi:hypothetical protein
VLTTCVILSENTITANAQVDDVSHSDVDDSQEALVLLLEFLLIEYLDCQYTVLIRFPTKMSASNRIRDS